MLNQFNLKGNQLILTRLNRYLIAIVLATRILLWIAALKTALVKLTKMGGFESKSNIDRRTLVCGCDVQKSKKHALIVSITAHELESPVIQGQQAFRRRHLIGKDERRAGSTFKQLRQFI